MSRVRSLDASPKKSLGKAASQTATDYGEASTIHGFRYILERGNGLVVSRIIWLVVVIAATVVGIFWSVEVRLAACLN